MRKAPDLGRELGAIAVVIPARSEQSTIGSVVSDVRSVLEAIGSRVEIIVVDDQSRDHTAAVARDYGARVECTSNSRPGLAEAFRRGVSSGLESGADCLVCIDADAQYVAGEIPDLLSRLTLGADLVVGDRVWRAQPGMTTTRRLQNRSFSTLASIGIVARGLDLQCGFRAFTAATATLCVPRATFTYTQEHTIRAVRAGLRIDTVPVSFMPRVHGRSRLVKSVPDYTARVLPDVLRARLGRALPRPEGRPAVAGALSITSSRESSRSTSGLL